MNSLVLGNGLSFISSVTIPCYVLPVSQCYVLFVLFPDKLDRILKSVRLPADGTDLDNEERVTGAKRCYLPLFVNIPYTF